MAKIIRRTWTRTGPLGRKVKHVACGYAFYRADGERERKVSRASHSSRRRAASLAGSRSGAPSTTP